MRKSFYSLFAGIVFFIICSNYSIVNGYGFTSVPNFTDGNIYDYIPDNPEDGFYDGNEYYYILNNLEDGFYDGNEYYYILNNLEDGFYDGNEYHYITETGFYSTSITLLDSSNNYILTGKKNVVKNKKTGKYYNNLTGKKYTGFVKDNGVKYYSSKGNAKYFIDAQDENRLKKCNNQELVTGWVGNQYYKKGKIYKES